MKTIRVQFLQGKWHDTETGEIIYMKHGQTYDIIGTDRGFETIAFEPLVPLDKETKLKKLQSEIKNTSFYLLAEAGEELQYKLNPPAGHPDRKGYNEDNIYNCILKEDQYLYLTKGKEWRLCSCICETTKPLSGEKPLVIEKPITGTSLNNLFAEMITTFYPHYRSTSGNALKNFILSEKSDLYNSNMLDSIRDEINSAYSRVNKPDENKKLTEDRKLVLDKMKQRFRGKIADKWKQQAPKSTPEQDRLPLD